MPPRDDHDCQKEAAIARLEERNKNHDDVIKRFDASMMSMSQNMQSMAENMKIIAMQGEQIAAIAHTQGKQAEHIDVLFSRMREHELEAGKESLAASRSLKNGALLAVIAACVGVVFKILFH